MRKADGTVTAGACIDGAGETALRLDGAKVVRSCCETSFCKSVGCSFGDKATSEDGVAVPADGKVADTPVGGATFAFFAWNFLSWAVARWSFQLFGVQCWPGS